MAGANEAARGGIERLLALLDRLHAIDEATEPRDLAQRVADAAREALGHRDVGVLMVDPGGEHVELAARQGAYERVPPGVRLACAGRSDLSRAVTSGEAVEADGRLVVGGRAGDETLLVIDADAGEAAAAGGADGGAAVSSATRLALLRALAGHAATALRGLLSRAALARETHRLEAVIGCSADAIITTDPRGCITGFSPGAEELFGFGASQVVGRPVTEYYLGGEAEARRVQRWLEEEGKVRNYEAWFRTARGEPLPASLSASVLRDKDGHVLGTLGILKDITVEKRLERKLSYTIEMLQEANENLGRLAVTDALSGLKNQRFFHRKLEEEMLRAQRTGRALSLLLIDIDKFKRFNDTHGHQAGDRVIQVMGETILQSIRKIDHGCRYGGEEFTVVLPETDPANATVVARRIQRAFAAHPSWAELGLDPPTISVGLAAFQEQGPGEADTDALVKRADDAMYRVKRRGGDDVEVDGAA